MAELTQEQARTLADGFFAVSKSVGDFRLDHFAEIPDAEQIQLRSLQKDLAQRSIDLTADAIRITLDDLKPTLARIGEVTKQVNEAVERLTDIRQVIGIATSFVSLGAAIVTGNPVAIAAALGNTVTAVEESDED
jgi:hypothetical protein